MADQAQLDVDKARETLIRAVRLARARKEALPDHVTAALLALNDAHSRLATADRDVIVETKRVDVSSPST